MSYINRPSNYDKFPEIKVYGYTGKPAEGYEEIGKQLREKQASVITVECYPGVNEEEVVSGLQAYLCPDRIISSKVIFYDEAVFNGRPGIRYHVLRTYGRFSGYGKTGACKKRDRNGRPYVNLWCRRFPYFQRRCAGICRYGTVGDSAPLPERDAEF